MLIKICIACLFYYAKRNENIYTLTKQHTDPASGVCQTLPNGNLKTYRLLS